MRRRRFFGTISAVLAFFGLSSSRASAKPASRPVSPDLRWSVFPEQGSHKTWPDGARDRTLEFIHLVVGDHRLHARLYFLERRPAGSFYRFDASVGSDDPEGDPDELRASSWGMTLEEVRERAELALLLMLDIKRLENEAVGSGWKDFSLLSSREVRARELAPGAGTSKGDAIVRRILGAQENTSAKSERVDPC